MRLHFIPELAPKTTDGAQGAFELGQNPSVRRRLGIQSWYVLRIPAAMCLWAVGGLGRDMRSSELACRRSWILSDNFSISKRHILSDKMESWSATSVLPIPRCPMNCGERCLWTRCIQCDLTEREIGGFARQANGLLPGSSCSTAQGSSRKQACLERAVT